MKNSRPAVSSGTVSLDRCLTLFNRIAADRGCTDIAVLAADMALPRSTRYRMTGALAQAGLIARVKPGHFGIGFGLLETLRGVTAQGEIAALSRPYLQSLAAQSHATAHLGVMENDMVTYLVKAGPGGAEKAVSLTRENTQLEAYCSGIGKVLLAWLPATEREKYLAGGNFIALTSRTMTEARDLRRCLKAVRAELFARDDGEVAERLYCLAVPLWTDRLPMTAAISLSRMRGPEAAIDDAGLLKLLRRAAAKISRKLGR